MIARVTSYLVCSALLGLALAGCGGSASSTTEAAPPTVPPASSAGTTQSTESTTGDTTSISTPTETQPETSAGVPTSSTGGGGSDPALAAAVAAYQAYVEKQSASLVTRTTAFSAALQHGDPRSAVHLYPNARTLYERISPVANRVRDGLGTEMDALQGDVPASQWAGFHKIEKILFDTGTTVDTEKPGRALVADAKELDSGVKGLQLDPGSIAAVAIALLDEASGAPLDGKEERWSRFDINSLAANVAGIGAAWSALRPLVAARDPKLAASVQNRYKDAHLTVESFKGLHGYRSYDELGPGEIAVIREKLGNLKPELEKIPPLLGA
jgi:iron uptake system EfeUOB component EfeO/EfeM